MCGYDSHCPENFDRRDMVLFLTTTAGRSSQLYLIFLTRPSNRALLPAAYWTGKAFKTLALMVQHPDSEYIAGPGAGNRGKAVADLPW